VLAVALALHGGLLAYFTPKGLLSSGLPIHTFDYALHVYQVDRALSAFRDSGHLWSYDPFVLAGQPAGAIEDLTSKSVELFVIGASYLGARPWVAFNAYVFLVHLAMPAVGWKAARLFGLSRLAAAVGVFFWVVLWHFDSFLHWCWYVGMISWGAASALIVLVVALMYRATRDHRASVYVALGAAAALVVLVHPFAVLTLAMPLAALYLRSFRRLRAWEHGALAAGAALSASTALTWVGPAIRFRHYIGEVDAFLWPTLPYVLFDWLDLMKDVLMTGQPVRTVFRTLVLALSVILILRWRSSRDDRALPLGLLVLGSFALAYTGGYTWAFRQTQPYRHIGPAALAAALVAAALVVEVFRQGELRKLDRGSRTAVAVSAILVLPVLARTVLTYLPTLLPRREPHLTAFRPGPNPLLPNDEFGLIRMGHGGPSAEYQRIGRYIDSAVPNGRVVAFDWVLGEYLSVFTHVPILGGIPQRNVPHVAAHPLRHALAPTYAGDDPFRRYLEEYAVAVVVTNGQPGPIDARLDLLLPEEAFGDYRLYRVQREPSYFAVGAGRVAEQRLNTVRVVEARGREVVLRFHWLETLRCRPNCTVGRAEAEGDRAGFLRVENPPSAFEIYNAY
jgi:hypothetical protein